MKRSRTFSVSKVLTLIFAVLMFAVVLDQPCSANTVYYNLSSSLLNASAACENREDTLTVPIKDISKRLNERGAAPAILPFGSDAAENEGAIQRTRVVFSPVCEKAVVPDVPPVDPFMLKVYKSEVAYISNISSSLYTKIAHKIE